MYTWQMNRKHYNLMINQSLKSHTFTYVLIVILLPILKNFYHFNVHITGPYTKNNCEMDSFTRW